MATERAKRPTAWDKEVSDAFYDYIEEHNLNSAKMFTAAARREAPKLIAAAFAAAMAETETS